MSTVELDPRLLREDAVPVRGPWREALARLARNRAAAASALILALIALLCIVGPLVSPRTMRAMSSHSTAPTARNISTKFRPKNTTSRITKNMKGSE